jgi:hypothetical protein
MGERKPYTCIPPPSIPTTPTHTHPPFLLLPSHTCMHTQYTHRLTHRSIDAALFLPSLPPSHTHTHTHTDSRYGTTSSSSHTHSHTLTHTHTGSRYGPPSSSSSQTHAHTLSHTHTHTHRLTLWASIIIIITHTQTHSRTHTHTQAHAMGLHHHVPLLLNPRTHLWPIRSHRVWPHFCRRQPLLHALRPPVHPLCGRAIVSEWVGGEVIA